MRISSQDKPVGIVERYVLPSMSTRKGSPHILLAEDDDEMRTLLARIFRREGWPNHLPHVSMTQQQVKDSPRQEPRRQ